ncbi:hypothetical protein X781_10840 [Mannheimia sp. USDA-ARS-USMARC-1261]|nr:hypothetical protein X781_10840 [Mannheimia sp. USDA-ARS-USMARC-1261]
MPQALKLTTKESRTSILQAVNFIKKSPNKRLFYAISPKLHLKKYCFQAECNRILY